MQLSIIQTNFNRGQRVEVVKSAPTNVYGFGRVEAECNARPGWYWVRFPQGELEMVQWVYLLAA